MRILMALRKGAHWRRRGLERADASSRLSWAVAQERRVFEAIRARATDLRRG